MDAGRCECRSSTRLGSFANGRHACQWEAFADYRATGRRTVYIARADVTDFLVAQLGDDRRRRQTPLVTT